MARSNVVVTDYGIKNTLTDKRYFGVSKFVNGYVNELFDPIAVSESLSKRTGIEPEVYLREWRESAEKGTSTHKQIETMINSNDFSSSELGMRVKPYIDLACKQGMIVGNWHSEIVCFSDDYNLAGIADLAIINKREKRFIVIDFKTNKKISFENFNRKNMKHPFALLSDCNYNHYQLQLNCYGLMLSLESGYKCEGMYIVHITDSNIDLFKVENYFECLKNELKNRMIN